MNEKVLLVDHDGVVSEFFLESSQDRDFLTIAERQVRNIEEYSPATIHEAPLIKKRVFGFHHLGPTGIAVYYELKGSA